MQAFVLMPNHFHLLLTTPEHDLGVAMNTFMSEITMKTNRSTNRSGRLFGGKYFRSLINSSRYFGHALKYVYRNPVKANLCGPAEAWPFSTLHGLAGNAHLAFPLELTRVGMEINLPVENPVDYIEWINKPFPSEAEKLIQRGLRKSCFDDLKSTKERKRFPILEDLL